MSLTKSLYKSPSTSKTMASSRLSLQISTTHKSVTPAKSNIHELIQSRRKTILVESNVEATINSSCAFTKKPSSFLKRNDSSNRRMSIRDERLLKILSVEPDEPLYDATADSNRVDDTQLNLIDDICANAGTANSDGEYNDLRHTQMHRMTPSTANDENTPPLCDSICGDKEGCFSFTYS